jgi:hypothetical protein
MRWLVFCLMFPLSASAASVLLIPVDEKARVLADELIEPFGAQKLTVKLAGPGSPAANCLKDPARDLCLGNIGEKAKVVAVFVVTGALRGGKANLTLEMLVDGAVVTKDSTRVNRGKVKNQMRKPVAELVKRLSLGEQTAPLETPKVTVTPTQKDPEPLPDLPDDPPQVTDTPKKPEPVALTPSQPADPLAIKTPAPKPVKPKVAAWVVTGLAVAAAGTAATFGGLGLAGKGRLEAATDGISTLSYNEAVALQQTSNTQLTVALGTGIGAGVTGVLAAILWGVD